MLCSAGLLFHWFAVSACNYARLVGLVHGLQLNEISRADLRDETRFQHVKDTVKKYVNKVGELADVLRWRNKVAGHFAITDPRAGKKDADNIATLDMSVMPMFSNFDGRLRANAYTLRRGNSKESHVPAIPSWSLTEVYEGLLPRYWPGIKPTSPKPPGSSDE